MLDRRQVNFHQLYIFAWVNRCGSFSRAAEQLNISQPAVSIQINELEKSLGFPLFHRRARSLELTEAGQMVYGYASRVFALAKEMQGAIQDLQGVQVGHLVLGASTTPGEYILPMAIGRFRQLYPNIRVELVISNTRAIIGRIMSRELDLGMVGSRPSEGVDELEVEDYERDEIVLVVAPTHPLAQGHHISLQDVMDAGLVIREEGSATRRAAEEACQELQVEPHITIELGSNQAIKQASAAGVGVGVISRHGVAAEVKAGFLKVLQVDGWRCERPLVLVYPKGRRLLPTQRAFLEMLQREHPLPG